MAEPKTTQTTASVEEFLNNLQDEKRRQDCFTILELMKRASGEEPVMWGASIVGFGNRHYKYASGHEGNTFWTGFAPRKQNITLYFCRYLERYAPLMKSLGEYKLGKGCLYLKKADDVDLNILERLITQTIADEKNS